MTLPEERHFGPWDERYARPDWLYGTEPNDFLRSQAERIPPGSEVLCLGDGEGRNGVFLARRGCRVTSVDQSAVGLEKARRLAGERGVELRTVHADLADFPVEADRWDAVVSIFLHLPPALRRRVHRDVVAGLRPGGVYLLEGYTPAQLARDTGGPPTRELMMELEALREELAGLDLAVAREVEREIVEGTRHTGTSCVVQVVGVKPGAGEATGGSGAGR